MRRQDLDLNTHNQPPPILFRNSRSAETLTFHYIEQHTYFQHIYRVIYIDLLRLVRLEHSVESLSLPFLLSYGFVVKEFTIKLVAFPMEKLLQFPALTFFGLLAVSFQDTKIDSRSFVRAIF